MCCSSVIANLHLSPIILELGLGDRLSSTRVTPPSRDMSLYLASTLIGTAIVVRK
jgi:hypothetical protein